MREYWTTVPEDIPSKMRPSRSLSRLLLLSDEVSPEDIGDLVSRRQETTFYCFKNSILTFLLLCLVLFNLVFLLRGFFLLPRNAGAEKLCRSTDDGLRRDLVTIDVAFFAKYAFRNMKIARGIDRTIGSILKHTRNPLHFHVILDLPSKKRVFRILRKVTSQYRRRILNATYYDVKDIARNHGNVIEMIKNHFFSKDVGRYNDEIFFMSEIFHRSFPPSVSKLIFLDMDLKFLVDIQELWNEFDKFEATNVIGIAPDLQPQYRADFARFRIRNPKTSVGSQRPGRQGFNTGVTLFDLGRMRQSLLYNSLLNDTVIGHLCEKYQFEGYLGHQDFFTLTGMEYPELYHELHCSWNRQLDTGWLNNFKKSVFDLYHTCDGEIKIYHGNGNANIPED